nr:hypothetical protein GCM10017588_15910 [Microbispora rosea subsp. aerata]
MTIDFTATTTRYVPITITANTGWPATQPEIKVYGAATTSGNRRDDRRRHPGGHRHHRGPGRPPPFALGRLRRCLRTRSLWRSPTGKEGNRRAGRGKASCGEGESVRAGRGKASCGEGESVVRGGGNRRTGRGKPSYGEGETIVREKVRAPVRVSPEPLSLSVLIERPFPERGVLGEPSDVVGT